MDNTPLSTDSTVSIIIIFYSTKISGILPSYILDGGPLVLSKETSDLSDTGAKSSCLRICQLAHRTLYLYTTKYGSV